MYGESAITAAPIFEAAGRGNKPYWGKWEKAAPTIILWMSLTKKNKKGCLKAKNRVV